MSRSRCIYRAECRRLRLSPSDAGKCDRRSCAYFSQRKPQQSGEEASHA